MGGQTSSFAPLRQYDPPSSGPLCATTRFQHVARDTRFALFRLLAIWRFHDRRWEVVGEIINIFTRATHRVKHRTPWSIYYANKRKDIPNVIRTHVVHVVFYNFFFSREDCRFNPVDGHFHCRTSCTSVDA